MVLPIKGNPAPRSDHIRDHRGCKSMNWDRVVMGQFEDFEDRAPPGVIPKPRAFTSGARDLPANEAAKDNDPLPAVERACQPGLAVVTTTGEEVQVVVAGVTLQSFRHVPTAKASARRGPAKSKAKPNRVRIRETHARMAPVFSVSHRHVSTFRRVV